MAGRREGVQGGPRPEAAVASRARPRLEAARPVLRHGAGRLPGASRPEVVRPGRPGAALPQARAAGRGVRRRSAVAAVRRVRGSPEGRHQHDPARACRRRARRPPRRGTGDHRRHRPAREPRTAADERARRGRGRRHRDRRRPPLGAGGALRGRREAGGAGRVLGHRQGDQPRQPEAAAGGPLRRAEHAEDEEDQDRLHHGRGRAAEPVRADRAPVPAAPARAPRRHAAEVHCGRPAEVGGRRRPHPHDVPPDDRRHGGCPRRTRTCRTSRSARTRAAASGRRSSWARATRS